MKSKLKALSKKDIQQVSKKYPNWKLSSDGSKLTRTFLFEKHIDALIFIARSTVNAEILKHYPEITFSHCKVRMRITTAEIKALTRNDLLLLKRIELVFSSQKGDNK